MHVFAATIRGEDGAVVEAAVVQLVLGRSLSRTLELLYNDFRELRLRADLIIARSVVEEQFDPEAGAPDGSHIASVVAEAREDPDTTFRRANDKPVRLLSSRNFEPILSGNVNSLVRWDPLDEAGMPHDRAIACIREAEMTHITGLARAMLPEAPGRAYRAPSGSLVRSFLRVGNIQFSRASLDALFFWLLPYLSRCAGILTDTWSISSLALNASRLLALYAGRPQVPVEMLSEYIDGDTAREAAVGESLQHLLSEIVSNGSQDRPQILCIISATQTGSLANRLTDILDLYCGDSADVHSVAVFKMGETDLDALLDWTGSAAFRPLSEADRVAADPVVIDPQLYFPLTFHDIEYTLRSQQASGGKRFLADYGGQGIVSVHRDHIDDNNLRHHGIHLDTTALVRHPTFVARFHARVLDLEPKPALIISPPHEAGRSLALEAQRALAKLGHPCGVFEHSTLIFGPVLLDENRQLRDSIDGLDESEAILIVDDMFMTGTRLSVYETQLRDRSFRGRLHYLVGVARPPGAEIWEERRQMRKYRPPADRKIFVENTVDAVETFFLPNWQSAQCPWCEELRIYSERAAAGAVLPPILVDRSNLLQRMVDQGMRDNLFLVPPGQAPLAITRGSVFAQPGDSQADVFASVASAIQALRCSPPDGRPSLGPRRFPVSTVLKGQEYLHDTYTDAILRASIIRAAEPDELIYTARRPEDARTAWISHLLTSSQVDEWRLAPELILAAALDKCSMAFEPEIVSAVQSRSVGAMATVLLGMSSERAAEVEKPDFRMMMPGGLRRLMQYLRNRLRKPLIARLWPPRPD